MNGKCCLKFCSLDIKAPHRLGSQSDQTGLLYHLTAGRQSLFAQCKLNSIMLISLFSMIFPSQNQIIIATFYSGQSTRGNVYLVQYETALVAAHVQSFMCLQFMCLHPPLRD